MESSKKSIEEKAPEEKWIFLAKRKNAPPLPVWNKLLEVYSKRCEKIYGTRVPSLGCWRDSFGEFWIYEPEFSKVTSKALILLSSIDDSKKHLGKSLDFCKKAMKSASF